MKFQLSHNTIVKAPGLLPMMYKVGEISDELNIHPSTLYDWLKNGAPHHRDNRGHIWINGQEFASWINATRRKGSGQEKLQDNEGFCMRCKKIVKILDPTIVHEKGKPKRVKGTCSNCKGKLGKGIKSNGQS